MNGPNGPAMLEWLGMRRSVREFEPRPVEAPIVERLLHAAVSAPSNTNRQPWRFAVVTGAATRARLAEAVRNTVEEMTAIIRRGHHADDFAHYGDFFFEPLAALCAAGEVRIHIDRTFGLDDVPAALAHVGAGRALGKVVVTP